MLEKSGHDERAYAYLLYRIWEGDDVLEDVINALELDGYIDDNQEWIHNDQ